MHKILEGFSLRSLVKARVRAKSRIQAAPLAAAVFAVSRQCGKREKKSGRYLCLEEMAQAHTVKGQEQEED